MTTTTVPATTYSIPRGGNRWCGPCALSYVARITPKEAAAAIARVTGRTKIAGMEDMELLDTLDHLGFAAKWPTELEWITVADFMNAIENTTDEFIAVINGCHYCVFHAGMVFDNLNRNGQPFSESTYKHHPVTKAWRITRRPAVIQ
jgi:hypothetical protein